MEVTLNRAGAKGCHETPTISVVCPTYNSAPFVVRALESVFAQTVSPFEIIVADDGSTDDTVEIAKALLESKASIASEVLVNNHRGAGAARNAGIRRAAGEWIAFLDSDDSWHPRKLEVVVGAIVAHPEAQLFCHNEEHRRSDGSVRLLDYGVRFSPGKPLTSQLYFNNLFSPSAVTCRRSMLHQSGLFDESLRSAQDYELWIRMSPRVRPVFIGDVLGYYYDRDGNISSLSIWRRWTDMVRIALRHRQKVPALVCLYRLLRVSASFGLHSIRQLRGVKG